MANQTFFKDIHLRSAAFLCGTILFYILSLFLNSSSFSFIHSPCPSEKSKISCGKAAPSVKSWLGHTQLQQNQLLMFGQNLNCTEKAIRGFSQSENNDCQRECLCQDEQISFAINSTWRLPDFKIYTGDLCFVTAYGSLPIQVQPLTSVDSRSSTLMQMATVVLLV
ncbi:MAG: hypothetical protein GY868_19835 [Deltaproteobacteria bacterium]|nr:hypothetical protein [Deltaproteobacteria bacterium]